MENKKVKNTNKGEYDGIKFRSQLEISCYKKLILAGFKPLYESSKFVLFEGLKLNNVLYYAPVKSKMLVYPRRILNTTYTPDFYLEYKEYKIYFDTKGQPNETYPIKKKLFLRQLEELAIETGDKYIFFEPHSVKQIMECIDIIQKL